MKFAFCTLVLSFSIIFGLLIALFFKLGYSNLNKNINKQKTIELIYSLEIAEFVVLIMIIGCYFMI